MRDSGDSSTRYYFAAPVALLIFHDAHQWHLARVTVCAYTNYHWIHWRHFNDDPRTQLVDASLTRWYHCLTPCVRRAFLLGEGEFNRKEWLDERLEELADIFAIGIGGFSVMDNHLHILVRLDPDIAAAWSDEEVWPVGAALSTADKSRRPMPATKEWVQWRLSDAQ